MPRALAAIALAVLLPPGRARSEAATSVAPAPTRATDARLFAESPLGVASAFPYDYDQPSGLATRFRECGAKWVRIGHISWENMEPEPPAKGVHTYDWAKLDEFVLAWEQAGFNVEMGIVAASDWAVGKKVRPLPAAYRGISPFPKPAYPPVGNRLKDYEAFVGALIERYDGDGESDAPGLPAPVLHYSFEGLVQDPGEWAGDVRDYGILFKAARAAGKKACSSAKIVAPDLDIAGLVAENPDETHLRQRLDALLPRLPSLERVATERLKDLFTLLFGRQAGVEHEIVSFRMTGLPDAIPGTVAWLRSRPSRRAGEEPVWIGELRSAPELAAGDPFAPEKENQEETRMRAEARRALENRFHPQHDQAWAWHRVEQARLVSRSVVIALASGVKRVFVSALVDEPGESSPWRHAGLLDEKGEPRPAYRAIALLAEKLGGTQSAEKLDVGAGVTAYRFHMAGGREQTWLWYDEGRPRFPGEPERSTSVSVAVSSPAVRVTPVPTGSEPDPRKSSVRVDAYGGRASFRLTATPLVMEPIWD